MISNQKKIAIVCANGLGDALITMVMAHNLLLNGYQPTIFSDWLVTLRNWFPNQTILPFPQLQKIEEQFQDYDLVVSTDGATLAKQPHNLGKKYHIFYEKDFDRSQTVVINFMHICRDFFQCANVTSDNGIVIPDALHHRYYEKRVIIHPMSTSPTKNWSKDKYLRLAKKLTQHGFMPVFITSPKEREEWEREVTKDHLPLFAHLNDLASYIYESGYMIGNDSGIGHLAANLEVPTLTLFGRPSVAKLWRPGWGKGSTVLPTWQLPGGRLRQQHWQKFLTVNKVLRAFEKELVKPNTRFIYQSSLTQCFWCDRHFQPLLKDFIENPESNFQKHLQKLLKYQPGAKSTVALLQWDDQSFVVKRYHAGNIWQIVKSWLRRRRSFNAWYFAQLLSAIGINTPQPVALIQKRFSNTAYLITEYIDGIALGKYFDQSGLSESEKTTKLTQLAAICRKLQDHYLIHRDLNPANILLTDTKIYLIDLDYMQQYPKNSSKFAKQFERNLSKFISYLPSSSITQKLFKNS